MRLTAVPTHVLTSILNEPRNARHMPLAGERFTVESTAAWVAAKDEQWDRLGYGPWGVRVNGVTAGWGGFQDEDGLPDLALVLDPSFRGVGSSVGSRMLDVGFDDLGFSIVTVALPRTRSNPDRALARWGFVANGDATISGIVFRRYRLEAETWNRVRWQRSGDG